MLDITYNMLGKDVHHNGEKTIYGRFNVRILYFVDNIRTTIYGLTKRTFFLTIYGRFLLLTIYGPFFDNIRTLKGPYIVKNNVRILSKITSVYCQK